MVAVEVERGEGEGGGDESFGEHGEAEEEAGG